MAMDRTVRSVFRNWSKLFSPAARKRRVRTGRTHAPETRSAEYLEDRTLLAVNTFVFNLSSNTPGDIDIFSDDAAGDIHNLLRDFNVTTGSAHDNGFTAAGIEIRAVPGENNEPPLAADDVLATDEDTTLLANVFAPNPTTPDSDPNTDSVVVDTDDIEVVAVNGVPANVGEMITLSGGSQLTLFDDGDLIFTPAASLNSLPAGGMATESFTYTIADSFGEMDSANVTININGLNDAPTIDDAVFSIAENAADLTSVGTPVSSDPDAGDVRAFQITGGNVGNAFTINPSTGEIVVNDTTSIDFEVATSYALNVEVSDGDLIDTAMVTINILDVEPAIPAQSHNVAENAPVGTSLGTVAIDPGEDINSVTWSITGGNTGNTFAIDANTGELTVANAGLPDAELTQPQFTLTVTVTDHGGATTASAAVDIFVTDATPLIAAGQVFSVDEDATDGTSVGTVQLIATADVNSVSFSIEPSSDPAGAFAIDANTGEITVADTSAIDFESSTFFDLTVNATDGSNTDMQVVRVNVNDQLEAVNLSVDSATAGESGGTTMVTVTATVGGAGVIGAQTVDLSVTGSGITSGDFMLSDTQITIPDGMTSGSVTFSVQDDLRLEGTETATLTISNPSAGIQLGATSSQTVTITDNESGQITLLPNQSIAEGQSQNVTATLSITTNGSGTAGLDRELTVDLTDTGAGSALSGVDYSVFPAQTLTFFAANGTSIVSTAATVVSTEDADVEDNETVSLMLSPLSNDLDGRVLIAGDSHTTTITNNDAAALSINDVTITETDTDQTVSFAVTLDSVVEGGFQLAFSSATGTADGADFAVNTPSPLTFSGMAGETVPVSVQITGDERVEGDESFTITLGDVTATTAVQDAAITTGDVGTGTIRNDDSAILTIDSVTALESNGATDFVFTVTLSDPVQGGFDIAYTTDDGTANDSMGLFPADYTDNDASLNFTGASAGETRTISVVVSDDTTVEADETFSVVLGALSSIDPTAAAAITIASGGGLGIITNDDTASISIAPVTALEANGTTDFLFDVTLDNDVQGGVTVGFSTSDGTASTGDNDYTAATGSVMFVGSLGETQSVMITVNDDGVIEADETFNVTLGALSDIDGTAADDITVQGTAAVGTITNDDTANLTISDVTMSEGTGNGPTNFDFTVELTRAVEGGLTVSYTTNDGTATAADGDYLDNDGVLNFTGLTDGEMRTITVQVPHDSTVEPDETFSVLLGALSGVDPTIAGAINVQASGGDAVITNDDSISVAFSSATASDVESSGGNLPTVLYTGTIQNGHTVDVPVTVTGGTATLGADFTAPGTITVTGTGAAMSGTSAGSGSFAIANDTPVEADQSITLQLAPATNVIPTGTTSHTYTITNDDTANLTVVAPAAALEGAGGATTNFDFTLTLDNTVEGGVTVSYFTNDGTAAAGSDYIDNDGTQAFNGSGVQNQVVTVAVTDDSVVEPNEMFSVLLGGLTNIDATAADDINVQAAAAVATITDDDAIDVRFNVSTDSDAEASGQNLPSIQYSGTIQAGHSVNVDLTQSGTATPVSDFTSAGTITIAGDDTLHTNETVAVPSLSIADDNVVEDNETIILTVDGTPSDVNPVSPSTHTYSINNDDTATLTISDITVTEGDSMMFTVTLDQEVAGGFTVGFSTTLGTAEATDFSVDDSSPLTFAGVAGETQTIMITSTEDTIVEANETFTITLGAIGATTAVQAAAVTTGASATGTILNDDTATLTIADVSADEGDSLFFTVTLSNDVEGGFDAPFAISQVSASDGLGALPQDYAVVTSTPLTFAAAGPMTIEVSTVEDTVVEADETLTVTLGALEMVDPIAAGAITVQGSPATGTIVNDDNAIISINGVSALEGTGGGPTVFQFDVSVDNAVQGGFDLSYRTESGTAVVGSDLVDNDGTLNFAGTAAEMQNVQVLVTHDSIVEANETFNLFLDALTGVDASVLSHITIPAVSTGTIRNDDSATITINDIAGTSEGSGGGPTLFTFTATLDNQVQDPFTLLFSTSTAMGSTATSGVDFETVTSGMVTFTGTLNEAQNVTVNVTHDDLIEPDETFLVSLDGINSTSGASQAELMISLPLLGDGGNATILDDDMLNVSFNAATASDVEAGGANLPTVAFTGTIQAGHSVNVPLSVTGGTATLGTDFVGPSTMTITSTDSSPFTIPALAITDDGTVEADETIILEFGTSDDVNPTGTTSHTYTITNDDSAALTITNVSQMEGTGGVSSPFVFDVQLTTNDVQGTFSVPYTLVAGDTTLSGADTDYAGATMGTVTFDGDVNDIEQITVEVRHDTVVEGDEQFTVMLGTPTGTDTTIANAITLPPAGTGTIQNDDGATVTVNSPTVFESSGQVVFTLTLNEDVEGGVTVDYSTVSVPGSAIDGPGQDYDGVAPGMQSVVFAGNSGETQSVTITLTDDAIVEPTETFLLRLDSASVASVSLPAVDAVATITDDDTISVEFDVATASDAEAAGAVSLPDVLYSGTIQTGHSVNIPVIVGGSGSTATAGSDYSSAATITVVATGTGTPVTNNDPLTLTGFSVNDDAVGESDETVIFVLDTSPTNLMAAAMPAPTSHTYTIENDDVTTITVGDVSMSEGTGGTTTTFSFPVTLSNALQSDLTVSFTTGDGTAVVADSPTDPSDNDYEVSTGMLTFPAGTVGPLNIAVSVNHDAVIEPDETFAVNLTGATSADLSFDTVNDITLVGGTGTITNDDAGFVSIIDMADFEGDTGTTLSTFTIELTDSTTLVPVVASEPITVTATTSGVTAAENVDYVGLSMMFTIPAFSSFTTFDVTINGDTIDEGSEETYNVTLSNLMSGTLTMVQFSTNPTQDSLGVGTITDDDP